MKRVAASFLVLIFALNVFGYYGVFVGARLHASLQIRDRFDFDSYPRSAELTFKIPLTLPYGQDMADYERVDGEFYHHGDVYRLVKQKFVRDTLYVVCVRDNQSKKIDKALEDYVKTFADNSSGEKSHSKLTTSISKDYFSIVIRIEKKQSGWEHRFEWPNIQLRKISSYQPPLIQPPRG